MNNISHFSISQLQLFEKNPRRYCLEYIEKIRPPPTPQLELGSKLHTEVEHLLLGRTQTATWPCVKLWFRELMPIYSLYSYRVEDKFNIWLSDDLPPFKGCIDLWYKDNSRTLVVEDHKTCHPRFRESVDTLSKNLQLSLYIHALNPYLRLEHKDKIISFITHNQFIKGRDGNPETYEIITSPLTAGELDKNLKHIEELATNAKKTVEIYCKEGLKAVRETPENRIWYGKECIFWPCITGQESIEECKKRIKGMYDKARS